MKTVTLFWLLLALSALLLEGWALGAPARGDTLSEHMWQIRAIWLGRLILGALFAWLFWHFVIDQTPGLDWKDAFFLVFGAVIAWFARARKEEHDPRADG